MRARFLTIASSPYKRTHTHMHTCKRTLTHKNPPTHTRVHLERETRSPACRSRGCQSLCVRAYTCVRARKGAGSSERAAAVRAGAIFVSFYRFTRAGDDGSPPERVGVVPGWRRKCARCTCVRVQGMITRVRSVNVYVQVYLIVLVQVSYRRCSSVTRAFL